MRQEEQASFADKVTDAVSLARAQFEQEGAMSQERRRRLVHRLEKVAPVILQTSAAASGGLLRYSATHWGSQSNDLHSLYFRRPDLRACGLFLLVIGPSLRASWQIYESMEPAGGLFRWLTLKELTEPGEFVEAKVIELIARYPARVAD